MDTDRSLDDLDAEAWRRMAFALQHAVLDQYEQIDRLHRDMDELRRIAQHAAGRADWCARQVQEHLLDKQVIDPQQAAFGAYDMQRHALVFPVEELQKKYLSDKQLRDAIVRRPPSDLPTKAKKLSDIDPF